MERWPSRQPVAGHDQRARRADGAGLVHRRNARDDRAENQEDQRQWRNQDEPTRAQNARVELALVVYGGAAEVSNMAKIRM